MTDKLSLTANIGWDSGVGKYTSIYTPVNGSWNTGLGLKFNPTPKYFTQVGFNYIWLDDIKTQHGAQSGTDKYDIEFKNNYALSYDFKIGYRF